jgi:hypothetical protein
MKRGNKMEKDKRRKIIVGVVSILVTIGLIPYLTTLPESEKPYWYFSQYILKSASLIKE